MSRYAANTEVSTERSRAEIERILLRYGASAFHYGWEGNRAPIGFAVNQRYFKIVLPLPDRSNFSRTPSRGHLRSPKGTEAAWEQACRQRWRALALWIKAVLEAAESGITTLEEALLPFLLLPDKQTVKDWLLPQVEEIYQMGSMPKLLPLLK